MARSGIKKYLGAFLYFHSKYLQFFNNKCLTVIPNFQGFAIKIIKFGTLSITFSSPQNEKLTPDHSQIIINHKNVISHTEKEIKKSVLTRGDIKTFSLIGWLTKLGFTTFAES